MPRVADPVASTAAERSLSGPSKANALRMGECQEKGQKWHADVHLHVGTETPAMHAPHLLNPCQEQAAVRHITKTSMLCWC
jgi:hypothetical protein